MVARSRCVPRQKTPPISSIATIFSPFRGLLTSFVDANGPTVRLLADLPVGWAAERAGVGQEWQRFQR